MGKRVEFAGRSGGSDDIGVSQHDSLGSSCRSGRVKDNAWRGSDDGFAPAFQFRFQRSFVGAPVDLKLLEGMQPVLVVPPESLGIQINQAFQFRQLLLLLQNLVHLLLISCDHEAGAAVREHVSHLVRYRFLIDGNRNGTYRLDGENRPVECRAVASCNGYLVAFFYAELD